MPKSPVTEAIKNLRVALGHTQQSFAEHLKLSISTVIRYEKNRPPKGDELARLFKMAAQNSLHDIAGVLAHAMEDELSTSEGRIPHNFEERVLMDLMLLAVRSRGKVAGGQERFSKILSALIESFEKIKRHRLATENSPVVKAARKLIQEKYTVEEIERTRNETWDSYGLKASDWAILEADVETLKKQTRESGKMNIKK